VEFAQIIATEQDLRSVIGPPLPRALQKEIVQLDSHCRAFISRSPFVLVGSCDAEGRMDVSPKGDPPGFVQVLDERTLAIPDRPGNRRADTFANVLQNPRGSAWRSAKNCRSLPWWSASSRFSSIAPNACCARASGSGNTGRTWWDCLPRRGFFAITLG
jgi:hypothetical protein